MSPKNTKNSELLIAVLGVVYGDIGTSPLYAIRDCFFGRHAVNISEANILGILSLVLWALVLVVCMKYLWIVLKADNDGEGGIMALLALLTPKNTVLSTKIEGGHTANDPFHKAKLSPKQKRVLLLGLFGAALLFGEGILAPSVSVLSAVEGLELASTTLSSNLAPWVVPITIVILASLFFMQRKGTLGIGMLFGPAMAMWFLVIAVSGLIWIFKMPSVLRSVDPIYAVRFLATNRLEGLFAIGSVVLCVTGAEALYAAMGHFGRAPIRQAWYLVVFPALVLNYLGQGSLLLLKGSAVHNPFFEMASTNYLIPLIAIATAAAVIASQALITGAFSLTQQATQLGYLPRFLVVHTSADREGQIYIPRVNQYLLVGCILLVIVFQNSRDLVSAYGISVMGTMCVTSYLIYQVARTVWGWSMFSTRVMLWAFLIMDALLLAASFLKILSGGWVSLAMALTAFVLMATWRRGRRILTLEMVNKAKPLAEFMAQIEREKPFRVKGSAIFMTPTQGIAPTVLLHHYRHNKVLHEQIILLTFIFKHVPTVSVEEHARVTELGNGIFQVTAVYGYMQRPNARDVLDGCKNFGFDWEQSGRMSFYLGRETLLTTGKSSMAVWRKRLFGFMSKNSQPASEFFGLPIDQVVEIGLQLEV